MDVATAPVKNGWTGGAEAAVHRGAVREQARRSERTGRTPLALVLLLFANRRLVERDEGRRSASRHG
jgi:hypothetical protein